MVDIRQFRSEQLPKVELGTSCVVPVIAYVMGADFGTC